MMTGLLIFIVVSMVSARKLPPQPTPSEIYGAPGTRSGRPVGPATGGSFPNIPQGTRLPTTPTSGAQGTGESKLFPYSVIGVVTFDRHSCIFQGGMGHARGPADLAIGEDSEFEVEQGTATLRTGESVTVDDGLVHARILHPRNTAAIRSALSRAGMTLEDFIKQIGTPLPEAGVIELTAGVISISGTYRNINAGVLIIVSDEDGTEPSPIYQAPVRTAAPSPRSLPATSPVLGTQGTGESKLFHYSVIGVVTFDRHSCIFQGGMGHARGPVDLAIGEDSEFEVEQGTATLRTGETVTVEDGLVHARILHPKNTAAIRSALSRAGMTLEDFIKQIGTPLPEAGVIELTAGVISISGTYRNINAGVMILVSDEDGTKPSPIYQAPVRTAAPQSPRSLPATSPVLGAQGTGESKLFPYSVIGVVTFDRHSCIFQGGIGHARGPADLAIGENSEFEVEQGTATLRTGETVTVEDGLVHARILHPRNTAAIRSALSRAGMTLEDFIKQIGTPLPEAGVIELTAGVISISGTYRNINAGVLIIVSDEDGTEPSPIYQAPVRTAAPQVPRSLPATSPALGDQGTSQDRIFHVSVIGVITFDRHACIFRGGMGQVRGPTDLAIGEDSDFELEGGTATLTTGESVTVEDGLIHVRILHPRNTAAIRSALSRAGMTLEEFIQRIGTPLPEAGVFEVTAGVVSISGTYRNINAGVFVLVSDDGTTPSPVTDTRVTETAAPVTKTDTRSVTLTKTSTRDEYITITSPVYNNAAATFTNFVRRTVVVPEEQVIRSPLPGSVIVNTIPVSTTTFMTVTDTATNYFVQTRLETVTSTLQHIASNFVFKTVTINNIITSSVTQTITRTSIATAYITNTVGRPVYSTRVSTVTVTSNPGY